MQTVTIYSRPACGYCERAKAALRVRNIPFREIRAHLLDTGGLAEFRAVTKGATTVPQILIGDRLIGGWDALEPILDTPEFQQMIGGN